MQGPLQKMLKNENEVDAEKDKSYFGYYNMLSHQQNMLQDTVRTQTYNSAILKHANTDFKDKVVLDVGCGTGLLSFFAVQAGARIVYAVEAAEQMAENARILVAANKLEGKVVVITGKIEEIELPEKVDVIVSEPMGVLLLHERMIESFLYARKHWLKPSIPNAEFSPSQMYPSKGSIYFVPFSDSSLYASIHAKTSFWEDSNFHGIDLTSLKTRVIDHVFSQPIVGGVDPKSLLSAAVEVELSFLTTDPKDLHDFKVPLDFTVDTTGICHGIAGWFDVHFFGGLNVNSPTNCKNSLTVLSTAPEQPRTHWHQVRLVFKNPIALNRGQRLLGHARFTVNDQRSYNIVVQLEVDGLTMPAVSIEQHFNLHDQQYWNLDAIPSVHDINLDYYSLYPTSL